eukprot:CAMPEP_0179374260 /NCGR_PEP_ID=MMETSP0797-20121207/87213_1 /TAXON_ID=47934 /ORGANISM="Dinophysis acuminata, Strain DAEP01" /LENGTH=120 /DNA_ID=CAMNT_0021090265 /DNA_START=149 /DNA_END=508 /DNA_ORIENTATION=-
MKGESHARLRFLASLRASASGLPCLTAPPVADKYQLKLMSMEQVVVGEDHLNSLGRCQLIMHALVKPQVWHFADPCEHRRGRVVVVATASPVAPARDVSELDGMEPVQGLPAPPLAGPLP